MALKQRQRVLVLDDEGLVRDALGEVLLDAGYMPVIMPDWETAEQGFEAAGYALVITDIFMPGKGGIEVIREIRERWPEVKILAMSGGWRNMSPAEAMDAAARIGADGTLTKPFEPDDLSDAVRGLIGDP